MFHDDLCHHLVVLVQAFAVIPERAGEGFDYIGERRRKMWCRSEGPPMQDLWKVAIGSMVILSVGWDAGTELGWGWDWG
jgi:hypothetical protein